MRNDSQEWVIKQDNDASLWSEMKLMGVLLWRKVWVSVNARGGVMMKGQIICTAAREYLVMSLVMVNLP